MNKKKWLEIIASKKVAPLIALLIALSAFGSTLAYYKDIQALENPLKTGSSGAAILEEFDPTSSFLPGEVVTKRVSFKNTGKSRIFLRVQAKPREGWYKAVEQNGQLVQVEADELDESKVIKHWAEAATKTETVNGVEQKLYIFGEFPGTEETNDWKRIGEYCYYKKILNPEETTNIILEEIQLDVVSNDRHAIDYSDKVYKLTFDAEAIPVEAGEVQIGLEAEWPQVKVGINGESLTWEAASKKPDNNPQDSEHKTE